MLVFNVWPHLYNLQIIHIFYVISKASKSRKNVIIETTTYRIELAPRPEYEISNKFNVSIIIHVTKIVKFYEIYKTISTLNLFDLMTIVANEKCSWYLCAPTNFSVEINCYRLWGNYCYTITRNPILLYPFDVGIL